MKTILIFSANTDKWGAERSTCSLCKHLKDNGFNILIIIPRDGSIIELFEENKLDYLIMPFISWTDIKGNKRHFLYRLRYFKFNLIQLIKLKYILKEKNIKPILVYSNTLTFDFGILTSFLFNKPHVQHIRENIDAFNMRFIWGFNFSLWIINIFSKKVICTCEAIKERYQNFIDQKKIITIYNGIPITYTPKKFKDPQSTFRIVLIARLMEDKRPIDLLKALKSMIDGGFTNISLDVFGEGPLKLEMDEFIFENNLDKYVRIWGYQSEIDLSNYWVGIMPSTFEAFARSTLEYMMNGLAVIGSDSGGTKEQIVHDETGLLYEPHNIHDLYLCIKDLYLNREKCIKYGLNGRKRVVDYFSQDKYVSGVKEQLKIVLNT